MQRRVKISLKQKSEFYDLIIQNANYVFQCFFSAEDFVFCEDFGVITDPCLKDFDLWLINHKIIRPDRFSNITTQGEGEYIRDG